MESVSKISDVKAPSTKMISLLNGKVARIGPITLDTMCWAEEKYGGWDKFTEEHLSGKSQSVIHLSEFMFELLENQDDFGDVRSFRKCFGTGSIAELTAVLTDQISASMPEPSKKPAKGTASKK